MSVHSNSPTPRSAAAKHPPVLQSSTISRRLSRPCRRSCRLDPLPHHLHAIRHPVPNLVDPDTGRSPLQLSFRDLPRRPGARPSRAAMGEKKERLRSDAGQGPRPRQTAPSTGDPFRSKPDGSASGRSTWSGTEIKEFRGINAYGNRGSAKVDESGSLPGFQTSSRSAKSIA